MAATSRAQWEGRAVLALPCRLMQAWRAPGRRNRLPALQVLLTLHGAYRKICRCHWRVGCALPWLSLACVDVLGSRRWACGLRTAGLGRTTDDLSCPKMWHRSAAGALSVELGLIGYGRVWRSGISNNPPASQQSDIRSAKKASWSETEAIHNNALRYGASAGCKRYLAT